MTEFAPQIPRPHAPRPLAPMAAGEDDDRRGGDNGGNRTTTNVVTEEATQIMLHVHQKGVGVCGVFTFEVAETKVNQTMELARKNQHPLQCTLEKE